MNTSLTPQEVLSLKKEILSSPHCALPGIVESFDDVAGTAVIRLVPGETGFRQMERRVPDGTRPRKVCGC